MSMLVQRKRKKRLQIEAPLTSLIDLVFLLLIYFLLTTNFMVDEGIKVNLPQATAAAPQTEEVITIYVTTEGKTFIGTEELGEAELFERLREKMTGRGGEKLVVVKADRGVRLDLAVKAMDTAKAAGAERLSLATERDA